MLLYYATILLYNCLPSTYYPGYFYLLCYTINGADTAAITHHWVLLLPPSSVAVSILALPSVRCQVDVCRHIYCLLLLVSFM